MIQLTDEQRQALKQGHPVRVRESDLGQDVVVLLADSFAALDTAARNGSGQRAGPVTWQEIFSSKLVVGSAAPTDDNLEVRRDDLLF